MQHTNSKAVIVWIDDYFISEDFENKEDKNIYWDQLFGRFSSKVYRLMDINIVIKGTRDEGLEFIKNISVMDGVYYFCILDMYIPLNRELKETEVEYSKDIAKILLKKNIDFAFLSSASKLSGDSDQALRSVDFYTKAKNEDFNLPTVLRQKILHQIKKNVHWVNIQNKLINKLEPTDSSNIKSQLESSTNSALFPFIDGFRDFIEFNEFDEIPFHQTLFIRSSKSSSEIYEMQCLLLMLTGQIFSNKKFTISYKKVTQNNFLRIEEDIEQSNEIVQCFRLKDISLKQFKSIHKKSTGKQQVYIVDTDDFQIEDYMNEIGAFVLKDIPTIKMSNNTLRTEILLHTLKYILNIEFDRAMLPSTNKSKSIYFHHPKLLIDPVDYIKFTDHSLNIKTLDDPHEIISEVFNLYEEKIRRNISTSIMNNIPLPDLRDYKTFKYQEENKVLVKSLIFWLENSWSMHYNVDTTSFDEYDHNTLSHEHWRVASFKILMMISRSLTKIDENTPFKEPLVQINKILKSKLPEVILEDKSSNELDIELELSTKIKWPHKYFPVPLIAHERLEKHGKTFWLQHNNFNNVEYSKDLKRNFEYLDQKIEYYATVLKLIESTVDFLPSNTHSIINKITQAIKREKDLTLDPDFREEFKNLSNTFIRIVLNFGILVNKDLENLGYDRDNDDKAKLGTHVATIRDRLLNTKQEIFNIDIKSVLHQDDELQENMNFIMDHTKLFSDNGATTFSKCISAQSNKKKVFSFAHDKIYQTQKLFQPSESYKTLKVITEVGDTQFVKGQTVDAKELLEANAILAEGQQPAVAVFDSPRSYLDSILRSDNINAISQISNLSKFLNQNDLLLQIMKNVTTVKLLSYMADTRNSWEHKTGELDNYFHQEKFFEFFIFSYESIWLSYSFLIRQIDPDHEMLKYKSKFVTFSDTKVNTLLNSDACDQFSAEFNSKKVFDYYLDNLEKSI